MNLTALKSLVRIHQVSSFTKAAELENVTLSALSMQMKALEDQLGRPLFDRSFRPPQLTPLGRKLAVQAANVVAAQNTFAQMAEASDALTGHYRIGFIPSASVRLLPAFLGHVRDHQPAASFEVSSGLSEDLSEAVRLGVLDAALVTRVAKTAPALGLHHIASEEMVFAAPAQQSDIVLSDLPRQLPFVHFRPSSGIGQLIQQALVQFNHEPDQIIVLDSVEAAMECVKAGLGYTLLPRPDVQRCADARVRMVPWDDLLIQRELVLAVHSNNADTDWAHALARILRENIQSGP